MNLNLVSAISDLVFIERKGLFTYPDVVLFHPGHFPELNKLIVELYNTEGFKKLLLPSIYNQFLGANEYDYYQSLLVEYGIPEEKIYPVLGEQETADDVIRNAMASLRAEESTVLLAGKAFFCRRFILLASKYAGKDVLLDVYPMEDDRGINKHTWYQSETGQKRVLNEVKQYSALMVTE